MKIHFVKSYDKIVIIFDNFIFSTIFEIYQIQYQNQIWIFHRFIQRQFCRDIIGAILKKKSKRKANKPAQRWWIPSSWSWFFPAWFPCRWPGLAGNPRQTVCGRAGQTLPNRLAWIWRCCRWRAARPVLHHRGSIRRRSDRSRQHEHGRPAAHSSVHTRARPTQDEKRVFVKYEIQQKIVWNEKD